MLIQGLGRISSTMKCSIFLQKCVYVYTQVHTQWLTHDLKDIVTKCITCTGRLFQTLALWGRSMGMYSSIKIL